MKTTIVLSGITNFHKMTTKHDLLLQPNEQKGATLVAGDSMLYEIDEIELSVTKPNLVKVKILPRFTMDNMKYFNKTLFSLNQFIQTEVPESNLTFLNIMIYPNQRTV